MATFQRLLILLILPTIWARVTYDGYRTFRITIDTDEHHDFLTTLTTSSAHYDVWKEARRHGDHMDVMVTPDDINSFVTILERTGVNFETMVEDVGSMLTQARHNREARTPSVQYDFTVYHTLAEIEGYLVELQTNHSSQVTLFDLGTSYEGRTIRGAKISSGGSGKPAVWIDSSIHANEWIATATTQYFIYKLLTNYATDPQIVDLLDNIDIYYVPVVNVDGYEYTWTTDRLWRKTRSPNAGSNCTGTDPNRNWDFFWCEQGSSTDPCSNSYCGSAPFSEPEVAALSSYVQSIPNLQMYFAYHCYGQWYMVPWAHYVAPPPTYDTMMTACNASMAALMAENGNTVLFECGTIQSFVGRTSGSSVDWVLENVPTVEYLLAPELRDNGTYGFELPPDQIVPSGDENYAAVVSLLTTIRNNNP